MLLTDYRTRMARARRKETDLLAFLADEVWTMPDLIGILIGNDTPAKRQTVYALTRRLVREGLLKQHRLAEGDEETRTRRGLVFFGITRQGRIAVGRDPEGRVFEPSKIRPLGIPHKRYAQKIRIYCSRRGWTGWEPYQQRDGFDGWGNPLPAWPIQADYVVKIGEKTLAIEAERTLKSAKRYREIWRLHEEAWREGRWDQVLYVLPSREARASFEALRERDEVGRSQLFLVGILDQLALFQSKGISQ